MKLFAEQVRTYVPADDYRVLGTDGFGRSDSRENLRHHFEVDASYVVVAALGELAKRGEIDKKVVADAIIKFNIDADKVKPASGVRGKRIMAIEINVPDIGADEVEITEILVKVGDKVEAEQSLITVEGDKALWKFRPLRRVSLKRSKSLLATKLRPAN